MTHFGGFLFAFLFILFILLIGYLVQKDNDFCWWAHLLMSPLYAVGSFIITVAILLIMFGIAFSDKEFDPSSTEKTEIYSIGINTAGEVHGHFVLGCGSVNGETYPTYRFYTMSDNRYHLNEVNANNFDIVCTDTVAPCIVYTTQYVEHPKRLKFIFNEDIHSDIEKADLSGTIYIPENSVVQSYKIQL